MPPSSKANPDTSPDRHGQTAVGRPDRSTEDIIRQLEKAEAVQADLALAADEQDRLAELGVLSAALAHEFNNLFTPALGYARLADGQPDDAPLQRKAVERCGNAIARAVHLSELILGLARPVAAEHAADGDADLSLAAEHAIEASDVGPPSDSVTVLLDVPQLRARIPSVAIEQVLINLLLNARRAVAQVGGGEVCVTAADLGHEVEVRITDTGPGVPAELEASLFAPFTTSHGSNGRQSSLGGHGLGLMVSRRLLEAHHGRLAYSRQGGMTIFIVTLTKHE